ncbi:MFS transporter [Caryophanon latum]|uniref:MFS transporter n=1 Tax=Caryophanon latum TaxID=33977 RepID=UPI000A05E9D0|nr:MFS transporter [Caryophanon latum]
MFSNKSTIAIVAILLGTFIVPINSTMVSVGLQSVATSMNMSMSSITWVVTIYLIVMTVAQPLAGKIGDLYGNRRIFLVGIVLFLVASIVCMLASNFITLLIGRAVQAFGGALITPNATAMLRYITPKEKLVQTFGIFGFSMSLGAAIGPLLGALLIEQWSWHATFAVNVPILVVAFMAAMRYVPHVEVQKQAKLDLIGSSLFAITLSSIVLIVTQQNYTNVVLWLIVIVGAIAFVRYEQRIEAPLIDFQLFRKRNFRAANMSILLNNGVMYGTLLLMPTLLVIDERFTLTQIGAALFTFSVAISIFSWIGGKFEGSIGRKRTITLAFIITALAMCSYFLLITNSSLLVLHVILFVAGIGLGIGVPSMQAASLSDVDKSASGVASGIYSTFRYIGSTIASVLISLQLGASIMMSVLVIFAVVGIVVSAQFEEM